ncbi:MAG TPA: endonuclease/exonuclease/phosphatase family protein [Longimicrobiales bacterium]|nr:endonuclease/exonuclease/phosphatase family protein [Longimicrobiales bacterium]
MRQALALSAASTLLVAACALPTGGMYVAGTGPACRENARPASDLEVVWVRAAAARDRALQSAWCATVGEPVVIPEPGDRFAGAASTDSLLVLSWNMNLGGGDLLSLLQAEVGVSCGGPSRPEATPARPFVLLVQEAYRRSERLPPAPPSELVPRTLDPLSAADVDQDITALAARCGLALVYVPSHRNGPDSGARPREDRGNAILSSLPLTGHAAIDLPFEAYRRVATVAEARLQGRAPLRVVSAHLDVSGLPFRAVTSGGQTRARQAAGLAEGIELLAELRPPVSGTVVGADMNTWSADEAAVRVMRVALPESPPHDRLATRGAFPADHIFFRSGLGGPLASGYRVVERTFGSDHHARSLSLTWP